jgi:type II secretory pathway predicted ATPase ExeA
MLGKECGNLCEQNHGNFSERYRVGQHVLKKTLELDIFAPVKTRLTCMFPMPRLSIEDARDFVAFRLKFADAKSSIFDADAIDVLATDAKGNRRTLCNMAALCLEEAARRNDHVVTQEIVTAVSLQCQL